MVSTATTSIDVLVVDDDSHLLRTLTDILNLRGYRPHVAASGGEGLAIAAKSPAPAVALIDLKLPDMDGLELVSRLREISALTETVILTGNASVDTAVRALREQSHDYLLKPVAPDQLLGVVSRASERWRRRTVEETLRQTEERAHLLLENITDVVAVLTPGGEVSYASASVERQLGYSRDEVLNRNRFDLVHPDDVHMFQGFMNGALVAGETGSVELRVQHRNGTWRTLACQITNLCDRPAVGGFLITARDVTDAQRLEQQFRQAQKMEMVGALAGGIAHDFNNVLTAVLGYSDLVLNRPDIDSAIFADVDEIRQAGQRASRLTRQLLAFSRQQPTTPTVLAAGALLSDLAKMLERLIGEQITLEIRDSRHTWPLVADPTHVEQVVVNLVVNARDAMPSGGTVVVETANVTLTAPGSESNAPAPGDYVRLTVRDSGAGMTSEVRARVFEPFFTTKDPGKGTGLGLATCYSILRQAGGSIVLDSEPGAGTSVHTYWPKAKETGAEAATVQARKEDARGTERILVVDDDDAVRRLAAAILKSHGYEVTMAASAEEALHALASSPALPHMVLTDVVLTGMSGWTLTSRLREMNPDIVVAIMSGYDKPPVADPVMQTFGPPLAKPFSAAELTSKVRQALDRAAEDRNP
jgi:two-component system cell cycle sensor histidine kinase/response regulator CckA